MKKFIIALFALVLVPLVALAPAHAGSGTNCKYYGPTNSWRVCISLDVNKQSDGTGSVLSRVTLWCGPESAFESPATYGTEVRIMRPDNTVLFSRTGSNSNIDGDCYRTWTPNKSFPGNYAWGYYQYKARLNNWPDADNQLLDIVVYN